ncbi:uncharacterized protein LOC113865198 [Abrus precatorius]|uniref:Uncharacterized protein LOC113865198 n=1 Tax=Abrus precatorius TaxID=3816 RepID=A0A8B8LGP2_ABRPR|nr:uncharacterized protein LOC113865198 [Abrus precatorius]
MSWLARSLANSLRLDADGDVENDVVLDPPTSRDNAIRSKIHQEEEEQNEDQETQGRAGVREDLNEIKQTLTRQFWGTSSSAPSATEDLDEIKQALTRQFWGMASFLVPPPTATPSQSDPSPFISNQSDHRVVSPNEEPQFDDAIMSNHSTDGEQGTVRTDHPQPNSVSSRSDSEENQEPERAVGITEEVLAFAMNIAMHPETWLDFPIDEEDDTDDFDVSDAQQEHAAVIERLTPRLAALRIELCPCHMSESYFWKVYFVLLHSRLNKEDAGILSTPQVMAARAMWMQELQKQTKPEFEIFGRSTSYPRDNMHHDDYTPNLLDDAYSDDLPNRTYECRITSLSMVANYVTEKHTVESSGTNFIDKSVIEENSIMKTDDSKDLKCRRPSQIIIQDYDDEDDEWPEEDSDLGEYGGTIHPMVNEEDISFSDLEDDDYGIKPVSSNKGSKVV